MSIPTLPLFEEGFVTPASDDPDALKRALSVLAHIVFSVLSDKNIPLIPSQAQAIASVPAEVQAVARQPPPVSVAVASSSGSQQPTQRAPKKTPKDRAAARARARAASPAQARVASPAEVRAASPAHARVASPAHFRAASPAQVRAASPAHVRAASPAQVRVESPVQADAASPVAPPVSLEAPAEVALPSDETEIESLTATSAVPRPLSVNTFILGQSIFTFKFKLQGKLMGSEVRVIPSATFDQVFLQRMGNSCFRRPTSFVTDLSKVCPKHILKSFKRLRVNPPILIVARIYRLLPTAT